MTFQLSKEAQLLNTRAVEAMMPGTILIMMTMLAAIVMEGDLLQPMMEKSLRPAVVHWMANGDKFVLGEEVSFFKWKSSLQAKLAKRRI